MPPREGWGYPAAPPRTGAGPYILLAIVLAMVADNAGWIDLKAATRSAAAYVEAAAVAYAAPPAKAPAKKRRRPRATIRPGNRQAAPPPAPSRPARGDIPGNYLALYQQAGAGETWGGIPAWAVLAGIGSKESDHGRSSAPGVRSGVNSFGCCAGPMQFNLRNGPPSTWDTYGRGNVYDPADAVPAAKRLLVASGVRRNLDGALYAYNQSWSYVADVKRRARRYQH